MPGRDGSGPAGQGPRSGRGMGNCNPAKGNKAQSANTSTTQSFNRGGRGWFGVFGRWFGLGRRNRSNWK